MNFLPSPGPLQRFQLPEPGDGLRIDTGVREGDQITLHYDPMIAKMIAHGGDRNEAIARMLGRSARSQVEGMSQQCARS